MDNNIDSLEKQIIQAQRASQVNFKALLPAHEWLRSKSHHYDSWHRNPYHNVVHVAILIIFVISTITSGYYDLRPATHVFAASDYTYKTKFGNSANVIGDPTGIAVNKTTGNVYIVDRNIPAIVAYDGSGNYIKTIGTHGTGDGQFSDADGIALDSAGNIFATDGAGNRIEEFDSNGNYLAQFGETGDGEGQLNFPQAIAFDKDGNILVSDSGNNRIEKFSSNDFSYMSQFGSSGSGDGQLCNQAGIAVDQEGNTWVADPSWCDGGHPRIEEFDSDGNYVSQFDSSSSDGGQINDSYGIAIGNNGNIYVGDPAETYIQEFDTNGKFIKNIGDNIIGLPRGVAFDTNGKIYVSDEGNCSIAVFNPNGSFSHTINRNNGQLNGPMGINFSKNGNLYVADSNYNRIQIFSDNGTYVSQFGSIGHAESSNAEDGNIYLPFSVTSDSNNNIYVADTNDNRIEKFDSQGNFISQIGEYGSKNGMLQAPADVAIDQNNNIWVSDLYNNRIEEFGSNGTYLSQIDGISQDDPLSGPTGIAVDMNSNIWVIDSGNNRVIKFNSSGQKLLEFSDNSSLKFSAYFQDIAIDPSGNVWVADAGNDRVVEFDQSGNPIYNLGSSGTGNGQFDSPSGLAFDQNGNLFVSEMENNRIQEFTTEYSASINVSGTGSGTITSNLGGVNIAYPTASQQSTNELTAGTTLTLTAAGSNGNTATWTNCGVLGGVLSGGGTSSANCSFVLNRDMTINATFTKSDTPTATPTVTASPTPEDSATTDQPTTAATSTAASTAETTTPTTTPSPSSTISVSTEPAIVNTELTTPLLPSSSILNLTATTNAPKLEIGVKNTTQSLSNANNLAHVLVNQPIDIAITPSNINGQIESVSLTVGDQVVPVIANGQGVYSARMIPTPTTVKQGVYRAHILVTYINGATEQRDIALLIDPSGYIYQKVGTSESKLKDVNVTLYVKNSSEWTVWDAAKYQQQNPQTTNDQGEYQFFVPAGTYRIVAEKSGFATYTSKDLVVVTEPITANLEMHSQKDNLGYWLLTIAILIVTIALIVIIGPRRRERITRIVFGKYHAPKHKGHSNRAH